MKYYQPETLSEATDRLATESGAKILAGGQSMMPLLRQDLASPTALVDITRVTDIQRGVTREPGTLRLGALLTYQDLLDHEAVDEFPLLRDSLEAIGDVQVRNAGTIGGGVAHADPAQDLPPALQCYEAEIVVSDGESKRTYDITDFFIDFYFTELAPHEIVTRVDVPVPPDGAGGAFEKHARTPGGYSDAGVAALVVPGDDGYDTVRLAYCAGAPVPRRVPRDLEESLSGGPLDEAAVRAAAEGLVDSLDDLGDVGEYDESYNEHVFRVLTKRALASAAERSSGPNLAFEGES